MAEYQLRYHRAILEGGQVLYPSGIILSSLDAVPGQYHNRFVLVDDEPAAPVAKSEPELEFPELPSEAEDLEG